jgi:ABC-type iron transport system FetAB ATPase subunit
VGRFDIHSTRVNSKVYLTDRNTKAIKHYKLWVKYWEQRNYYYPGSVRDNYSDPWYYEIKRSKRVDLR